jgi:hypothetical protein
MADILKVGAARILLHHFYFPVNNDQNSKSGFWSAQERVTAFLGLHLDLLLEKAILGG